MQAIIIDDEKHCRKVLSILLKKHCPNIEVVAECIDGKEALITVAHLQPNIVFLDIEMPNMNGFEFLEKCVNKNFLVVFTTAYNEYAIQAIKNNALDYLLKPIDAKELTDAIEKCEKNYAKKSNDSNNIQQLISEMFQGNKPLHKERFIVHSRNKLIPIEVDSIAYFYRNFINYLVTFSGEKYPITQATLEEVEAVLDARIFYRANRQYLINIKAIESIKVEPNGNLQLQIPHNEKQELEISRKKASEFRKWLGN